MLGRCGYLRLVGPFDFILFFKKIFINLFQGTRMCAREGGIRGGGSGKESQGDLALSLEANVGLSPTSHEIMT